MQEISYSHITDTLSRSIPHILREILQKEDTKHNRVAGVLLNSWNTIRKEDDPVNALLSILQNSVPVENVDIVQDNSRRDREHYDDIHNKDLRIDWLTISGFRGIPKNEDKVEYGFSFKWIDSSANSKLCSMIILGENGTGKSSISVDSAHLRAHET